MDDSRKMWWHPPQPVAFALIEAKRFRDRGESKRRAIVGNLVRRRDGDGYGPMNAAAALDCLSDLSTAVLHAFTAVESLANHSIDQLDDDAVIEIEFRKGEPTVVPSPRWCGASTWTRS